MFKFLKEHRIICCKKPSENMELYQLTVEKSILEQTLEELTEDTLAKDKYIEKLKMEIKVFSENALKSESKMQEILDEQERLLKTVNKERNELKTLLDELDNKKYISIATQTDDTSRRQWGI